MFQNVAEIWKCGSARVRVMNMTTVPLMIGPVCVAFAIDNFLRVDGSKFHATMTQSLS